MAKSKTKVEVIQDENQEPVPAKIIAQSIVTISKAVSDIRKSGLNEKALIILLTHSTGLPQTSCRKVVNALETLKRDYTT